MYVCVFVAMWWGVLYHVKWCEEIYVFMYAEWQINMKEFSFLFICTLMCVHTSFFSALVVLCVLFEFCYFFLFLSMCTHIKKNKFLFVLNFMWFYFIYTIFSDFVNFFILFSKYMHDEWSWWEENFSLIFLWIICIRTFPLHSFTFFYFLCVSCVFLLYFDVCV